MPTTRDGLKSRSVTGSIITEELLHDMIEKSHNEVSTVSSATKRGIKLSWVNTGNVYSFWFGGIPTSNTTIPDKNNPPLLLFNNEEVPILNKFQGEPVHLLGTFLKNSPTNVIHFTMIIDENGIKIQLHQTGYV